MYTISRRFQQLPAVEMTRDPRHRRQNLGSVRWRRRASPPYTHFGFFGWEDQFITIAYEDAKHGGRGLREIFNVETPRHIPNAMCFNF